MATECPKCRHVLDMYAENDDLRHMIRIQAKCVSCRYIAGAAADDLNAAVTIVHKVIERDRVLANLQTKPMTTIPDTYGDF